jgi:transcriptional regulator with XRE-family HTH domain
MKGAQITAARTLLMWTKTDLAERAGINRRTVANIESGKHVPNPPTLALIQRAFEAAGIDFIEGKPVLRTEKEARRTEVPSTRRIGAKSQ